MQHPIYETWPYKKVLPEHVPELIARYEGGESARKISLDMPFAEDVALKVLRDFGVVIKTRKEVRFSEGCTLNREAFCDFNDPATAYFVGWLLTDGNIKKTKYGMSVSLELSTKDRKVLESLASYLNLGEGRIRDRSRFDSRTGNTYYTSSIAFSYDPINERLISLGISERKSTKEIAPDALLYNRDFWRGVLEGDGYLSKLDSCTKMQICGSETLCHQWFDYCKSVVPDMHMTISHGRNGLFHTYSGRFEECKSVLDSLYLGVPEHLRLERKYNLYVGRYYDGIDPN